MSKMVAAAWPDQSNSGGLTDDFGAVLGRAQEGEGAAFETLYRVFQPPLLRYLHTRSTAAEDIASETWLAIISDLGGFSGDEPAFRAWIFAIGRHRAIDAGRYSARRPVTLVGENTELFDESSPAASDAALEHLGTAAAVELVAALPPDQAEAVALRFIADLDVATVAKMMGRRPGAVRVLTHRGLRTLADRLGSGGEV
jgi:RNA polymerase sigma-70 factor (ECF subfamily)